MLLPFIQCFVAGSVPYRAASAGAIHSSSQAPVPGSQESHGRCAKSELKRETALRDKTWRERM